MTPTRLLFAALLFFLLYAWLRLTDPDPADSLPAWPFRDEWRERMELDRVNGRNIVLPEEWTR